MTITKKDLQVIIPFILFVGIGIYGDFSVNFILRDKPFATTLKWCGVPILLFAVYYAYRATFGYPQKASIWRNTLGFFVMTAICSMLFFVAFEGFLILFNCNIGHQNDYQMKGIITKIEATKSKSGRILYTLLIHRELEKDIVKIDIPKNEFMEGQLFVNQMKVGSLGFIYSNQ